jgi:hypothetical protein
MMPGTNDCIGLAPDGITDAVAVCQGAPEPSLYRPRTPRPACIIVPDKLGEQPLAGDAAFESLDGRGWDPNHSRPRQPVLPLLLTLGGGQGTAASDAGNWLAAHVRALSHAPTARHIIAVPDRLGELGQQRLLDALRRANIPVELLWRPIATVLGWACRLSARDIDALHGQSVLVVHLGCWSPEVSRLDLEVETVKENGSRWLVPIRNGRGSGLPAGQDRFIEHAARLLLAADLARNGQSSDVVDPALVWVTRRPWVALCGESQATEIIRDCAGCWQRLQGALPPSVEVAEMLRGPIQAMLHAQVERGQPVHRILIDGPLTRLNIGPMNFGDRLAEQLRVWMSAVSTTVEVLPLWESVVASGAAHYGWRQSHRIPGYYDSVPDLLINACVNGRPEFISLMEGQHRVPGGTAMPPKEDDRFSLAAGADRVEYYLARGDESTVRKAETLIPEPPKEATKLVLVVRQTPGQGFAEVEVRAAERGQLGVRPVFLDWRLMDDTALTRDQVLKELSGQCTVAFPDPEPIECHAAVWRGYNLPSLISDFLHEMGNAGFGMGGQQTLSFSAVPELDALNKLHNALNKKPTSQQLKSAPAFLNLVVPNNLRNLLPDDDRRLGVVSSEGAIPEEKDLVLLNGKPPSGFKSYRALFDAFVEMTDNALAKTSADFDQDRLSRKLRKKLLGLGSWCYTSAAPIILDEIRSVLDESARYSLEWQQEIFRAAGRCLYENRDVKALFNKTVGDWKPGRAVKIYRIAAVAQVLAYRSAAANCLTPEIAFGLAQIAIETMAAQHKKPANRFLSAAAMLMMLLRYRVIDPGFLNPSNEHHRPLVDQINKILDQPLAANLNNRDKLELLFKVMRDFIAARGSPLPIYGMLTSLGDEDDVD